MIKYTTLLFAVCCFISTGLGCGVGCLIAGGIALACYAVMETLDWTADDEEVA